MTETNANLQKYVDTSLTEISPLKQTSQALLAEVQAIEVSDAPTLKAATAVRKKITAHEKEVKDLRMSYTRQLDDVKSQFIEGERDVLAEAVEAKSEVSRKIVEYEEEQERIRQAEIQRINKIIDKFQVNTRTLKTIKSVDEYGQLAKGMFEKLKKDDQNNPHIKLAFTTTINALLERKEEIRKVDADTIEAQKAALERKKAAKIAQEQADKAAKELRAEERQAPKTGTRIRMSFEVVDADQVPRELCVPSDTLIREYINRMNADHIPGVLIKRERSL